MSGPLHETPTLPPVSCQLLEMRFGAGVARDGVAELGADGSWVAVVDDPPPDGDCVAVEGISGEADGPPCAGPDLGGRPPCVDVDVVGACDVGF